MLIKPCLGNGQLKVEFGEDIIEIPEECVIEGDLIDELYTPDISLEEIKNICIFSPKNEHVDFLNNQILTKIIPGEEIVFKSIDSVICDDPEESVHFPTEYINSLSPSGMPPHELKLKIGAVVMVLRNLNSSNGQCNGTRAIIRGMIKYNFYFIVINNFFKRYLSKYA